MSARGFVDTNILLYSADNGEPEKRDAAIHLLRRLKATNTAVTLTQALQEYFVNAIGKLKVSAEAARRQVELFSQLEVVRIDTSHILEAIDLHRLHSLAFWDALILAAALRANCRVLYTEDFQTGRRFGRLEIVNPFLA